MDANIINRPNGSSGAPFLKVTDSRGKPIRGLWRRNQRFYAQLRLPGKKSNAKIPLVDSDGRPLESVSEARAALQELLVKRRQGSIPIQNGTLTFREWIDTYLLWLRRTEAKSPLTIAKEAGALANWAEHLGSIRVSQVNRAHINEFIAWRKESFGVSNRTLNLDVVALSNCLRHARDEGRLVNLPTESWRPLEHRSPRRPLWTREQIELLCEKAVEVGENGQILADYVRFLAFSGARRNEGLAVAWADVNLTEKFLCLNRTKYNRPRSIDLNPALEAHLRLMLSRAKTSKWLFPSPGNNGQTDEPAATLQGSLETARAAAGLPGFRFHDLRTYFISHCVMIGLPSLTIARWVGHKDAGLLIAKVYGHLNNEHLKSSAAKLTTL